MQYDKNPSLLSSMQQYNTCLAAPTVTGKGHRKIEPKAKHFSHCKKDLAMGEVLSFGFDLAVSLPSDRRGSKARIAWLPSRITRWGLFHIACIYLST